MHDAAMSVVEQMETAAGHRFERAERMSKIHLYTQYLIARLSLNAADIGKGLKWLAANGASRVRIRDTVSCYRLPAMRPARTARQILLCCMRGANATPSQKKLSPVEGPKIMPELLEAAAGKLAKIPLPEMPGQLTIQQKELLG